MLQAKVFFLWLLMCWLIWVLPRKVFGQRSQNNFGAMPWTVNKWDFRLSRFFRTFSQRLQVWGSNRVFSAFPFLTRAIIKSPSDCCLVSVLSAFEIFVDSIRFKGTIGSGKLLGIFSYNRSSFFYSIQLTFSASSQNLIYPFLIQVRVSIPKYQIYQPS